MSDPTPLIEKLLEQEHLLERRRTRALASQSWTKVIQVEAQLAFSKAVRENLKETYEASKPRTNLEAPDITKYLPS